jgi:hypothetical protein
MMDYLSNGRLKTQLADRIATWADCYAQPMDFPVSSGFDDLVYQHQGYVVSGTSESAADAPGGVNYWEPYAQPAAWSLLLQSYWGSVNSDGLASGTALGGLRLFPVQWFLGAAPLFFGTQCSVGSDLSWSVAPTASSALPEWLQHWYRAGAAKQAFRVYLHWLKRQGANVRHLVDTWASLRGPRAKRQGRNKRKLIAVSVRVPRRRFRTARAFAPRRLKRHCKKSTDVDASSDLLIDRKSVRRRDQSRGLDRLH